MDRLLEPKLFLTSAEEVGVVCLTLSGLQIIGLTADLERSRITFYKNKPQLGPVVQARVPVTQEVVAGESLSSMFKVYLGCRVSSRTYWG